MVPIGRRCVEDNALNKRNLARWLVLLAFLSLAACGLTTTSTGRYVSDATVAQLLPGKTDADWVRLVLGEPDERRIGPGESETWVWHHRRTRREHKLGAETEWIERITFVAFTRDGRIERAWIEQDRSPGWPE